MITAPDPALYWILAAILASLVAGSIVRFIALRNREQEIRKKRFASLRTWWILAILLGGALLAGRPGVCLLYAVASCIAWSEYTRICALRTGYAFAVRAGYALIVINYLLILFGAASLFRIFLPLASMLVFSVSLLVRGEPAGYIRSAGSLMWGMLFIGYGLSHAAYLMTLPAVDNGPVGPAGWFLFLVILTEANDIFQAVVGRAFGAHKKHRITPVISPNKTWEGFLGGMLIIIAIALLVGPWLVNLDRQTGPMVLPWVSQPWLVTLIAAALIALAGFFGDINMSAIKRDGGVKDSSNLLPGIGGVIDRIDSLTITAPVFVYFLGGGLA